MKRQQGVTTITLLMILFVIGMMATFAINVVPAYVDNYTVKSILTDLDSDPEILQMSESEVRSKIGSMLSINNVSLPTPDETIVIKKSKEKLSIVVEYEVRQNFLSNIDVVVFFNNQFEKDL